jgi:ATP-dependent helicase/nuclease subunit B
MPPSQTTTIDGSLSPAQVWTRVAEEAAHWATQAALPLRDMVVLVPFVQLLEPARRAFASLEGWQPRVETTATLAAALAPSELPAPSELSGSSTLDTLVVAQMLQRQGGFEGWERRDPRSFTQIVQSTVATAHEFHRAAAALAPDSRAAWWSDAGAQLAGAAGPGTLEASLCRIAFEWARLAPVPATDALFDARPAAWVVVQAAGIDPLLRALLDAAACPTLTLDTDASRDDPFAGCAGNAPPRLIVADGLEAEAFAAAAEVIGALNSGHTPVALIALDRVLTRRVRALLERQQVALVDETGWALSTTRAAARVMALLRSARPDASADDRLEWLKGGESALAQPAALQRLESVWRSGGAPAPERDRAAAALWADAVAQLAPLRPRGRLSLESWLQGLASVLETTRLEPALRADVAGAQVVATLRLAPELRADAAWSSALRGEPIDLAAFTDWVDRTLESASFAPPAGAGAEVVITPLAQALLRPFGAVIVAGADERHLGTASAARGLLPDATARALGIDTSASRLQRELLAVAQLMRAARITLLHRRLDGDEPVTASPVIDAIALARRRLGGAPFDAAVAATTARSIATTSVPRPAPAAPGALPLRLSASSVESLRACPYQFFARSVLGLREADELDDTLDKRDYGTWLHAVLHRFHRDRDASNANGRDDSVALCNAADVVAAEMGLDAARLLPYRAGFEHLVPAYLDWLHARDARGVRWIEGEQSVDRAPPELEGVCLQGRIDRIDAEGDVRELIDYKTGNVQRLRGQVRDRLEDTQLAFYALLIHADLGDAETVRAGYLALDDARAPVAVPHAKVADSARVLLRGLAEDLRRLRAGAGLGALGEGTTCEYCEARGLCRRDHWAAEGTST